MKEISSLGGLRAIAVTIVIAGHLGVAQAMGPEGSFANDLVRPVGGGGVALFFAISGFLITRLLLGEENKAGRIHLSRFYARRIVRLWPALWVFLSVVLLLRATGQIDVPATDVVAALFFVTDYAPAAIEGPVGHTWSLAVEEQFYLVWPLLLMLFGRRRVLWLTVGIVAAPAVRVLTYLAVPGWLHGQEVYQFHQRYDSLAMGCLLALLWAHPKVVGTLQRHGARVVGLGVALVVATFVGNAVLGPPFRLLVGMSVEAVAFALIVGGAVAWQPAVLQTSAVKHVGLISYSLYLWQHVFTISEWRLIENQMLALVCLVGAAEASYWLIERRFESVRRRLAAPTAERVPTRQPT